MKIYNLNEIRRDNLCYDPSIYLPEDWKGTAIDILNINECPLKDRIWIVCDPLFLSYKELRLFAVWCARTALKIKGCENEVCSNTCNVAERFANDNVTGKELAKAWKAADAAVWEARAAAAAWPAMGATLAAREAAGAASDAKLAAWAAREAAGAAAGVVMAARAAAREAAGERQKEYLINLFLNIEN